MAVEQSAGADVVETLLVAGANYDVTEKVSVLSGCDRNTVQSPDSKRAYRMLK